MKYCKFLSSLAIITVFVAHGTVIAVPNKLVNSPKKPAQVSNTKSPNIQSVWKNLRLVYILDAKSLDAKSTTDDNILKGRELGIYPVAISPDGNLLASAGVSQIRLFNLKTGKEENSSFVITQGNVPVGISSITFSPDGQLLVTGSQNYLISKPDPKDPYTRFLIPITDPVADGENIQVWNTSTHSLLLNIGSSTDNARISSLGQLVYEDWNVPAISFNSLSPSSFPKVVAVNLKDRQTFSVPFLNAQLYPARSFTIFPNDSILVITNGLSGLISNNLNKSVRVEQIQFWDLKNGKLLGNFNINGINGSRNYSIIAVSPDGAMLVGLSQKNLLTIINVQGLRAKLVSKIPLKSKQFTINHKGNITFLSFTPDHQVLATASEDKTIKLWDVNTGTLLKTISDHKNTVTSLAFSPDNKTLVTSDKDGKIMIWRND